MHTKFGRYFPFSMPLNFIEFGHKRWDVTGRFREIRDDEVHNLCS